MEKINLSPSQKRAVQHDDGPLLVIAGPGSGKTLVVTERVRRLLREKAGHFRILAVTFTNKAANEMEARLAEVEDIKQRAFIGTLHSFCTEVLANRGQTIGIDRLPHIFESYADRREVLRQMSMEEPLLRQELRKLASQKERKQLLDNWLSNISEAKGRLVLPTNTLARTAYEAYNAGLEASNAVDFDDLLLLTHRLFQQNPRIARFYRRLYRYLCIDEAQDLNEAQYQLIKRLCGGEYTNIMMVGDPKQAIYAWNGASPRYMKMFANDFGAEVVELVDNFRCAQAIVDVAKRLNPSYTIDGNLPVAGMVQLIVGKDEREEAEEVIKTMETLMEHGHTEIQGDIDFSSFALLARNRYALAEAEAQIKARNWPYYKKLTANHESESTLVNDFERCIRIIANPDDQFHNQQVVERYEAIIREADISVEEYRGRELLEQIGEGRDVPSIDAALLTSPHGDLGFTLALKELKQIARSASDDESKAMILEDIEMWRQHWNTYVRSSRGGNRKLREFLTEVALGSTQQPNRDGIALLTIHSSKGMEFDVVCLLGMVQGVLPDYRANSAEELAEEQRNAFVAVTRARRILVVSYPRIRVMPWGERRPQQPSPYLRKINLL